MKAKIALLLCFSSSISFAATDKSLILARESLLSVSVSPQTALLKYAAAAKKTVSGPVAAEYAYALAYAGLPEAALYNIDRALITDPLHAEVRFYLSELLNAFGLAAASDDIQAPVPAWLKAPLKLPALDLPAPARDFETASAAVNLLLAQKRYAQGAVLLDRLCKAMPDNARCSAGYALALEKLGCFKAAAAQARRNGELAASPERKAAAVAFAADLEKRQPLKYSAPVVKPLKGRDRKRVV